MSSWSAPCWKDVANRLLMLGQAQHFLRTEQGVLTTTLSVRFLGRS